MIKRILDKGLNLQYNFLELQQKMLDKMRDFIISSLGSEETVYIAPELDEIEKEQVYTNTKLDYQGTNAQGIKFYSVTNKRTGEIMQYFVDDEMRRYPFISSNGPQLKH